MHHLHVWSLDGAHHVLTTHLVVDDGLSLSEMANVRARIKARLGELGIQHATVEIETRADGCIETCHFAQP